MQFEGFLAEIEIDEELRLLRGIVVNAHEVLKFEGATVENLQASFQNAIEAYRDRCRTNGIDQAEPTRPISKARHSRMLRSAKYVGRYRPGNVPDYWTLQAAYDELLAGLLLASEAFVTVEDSGRKGAMLACQQMQYFLRCRWENPELAAPFMHLSECLADVERGRKPDIFYPKHLATKRPQHALRKHVIAFVAALHEADIKLGTSAKVSKVKIARAVNKWSEFKEAQITGSTIKNWRDQEKAKSKEERAPFETIVNGILAAQSPKQQHADFLKLGLPGMPKPPKE